MKNKVKKMKNWINEGATVTPCSICGRIYTCIYDKNIPGLKEVFMIGKFLLIFFGISFILFSAAYFVLIDGSIGEKLQSAFITFFGTILFMIGLEW